MHLPWAKLAAGVAALSISAGAAVCAEVASPPRPALEGVEAVAKCKMRTIKKQAPQTAMMAPLPYAAQPAEGDPLDEYANRRATEPAGDAVDLEDPWLRLLVLGRDRPRIVDVAILVDGKSFRTVREAWINGLAATPPEVPRAEPAKGAPKINVAPPAPKVDSGADVEAALAAATPGVSAQARSSPTLRTRLADYVAAAGGEVDQEEIRWLVAEWGGGPGVLLLAPSRTWERAGDAPLWVVLDGDADGMLSAAEIAAASARLQTADRNQDDVLTLEELRRVADRPGPARSPAGYAPLIVLDAAADDAAVAAELARVYGEGQTALPTGLSELLARSADVSLRVDLSAGGADNAGVSLLQHAAPETAVADAAAARAEAIELLDASEILEFSAARSTSAVGDDGAAAQIAIGAVFEGRPLWNALDLDRNGRLSHRERSELPALLAKVDRDGDGTITAAEIPARMRLCVTLGPWVHEALAAPGDVSTPSAGKEAPAPPAWFASMDRNGDGDLSREEFLGDGEQFGKFDADGDGLLSAAEVLAVNQEDN